MIGSSFRQNTTNSRFLYLLDQIREFSIQRTIDNRSLLLCAGTMKTTLEQQNFYIAMTLSELRLPKRRSFGDTALIGSRTKKTLKQGPFCIGQPDSCTSLKVPPIV